MEEGRPAVAAMTLLSRMSDGQATELRELENTYEGVIDENSRVYAGYLKELLRSGDGISPPELVFPALNGVEEEINEMVDEAIGRGDIGSTNGRFNEEDRKRPSLRLKTEYQRKKQTSIDSTCFSSSDLSMIDDDKFLASSKPAPPKDFVCPITSNLFDDPVTLETGQTYERRAIQEWLERGNMTCPITRQKLHSSKLPKTNYVLKRLIASWREENAYSTVTPSLRSPSPELSQPNPLKRSPSPTTVITKACVDGATGDLPLAINTLCTSDVLSEAEMAVLQIERLWRESGAGSQVVSALSKPAVVNGFVEILFNSIDLQVLRTSVFLLSELASMDKLVIQTLSSADSDVECMAALFKKGLAEAVVLIYLLHPSWERLIEMDMVEALLMVLKSREDDSSISCMKPKTASILLLQQILASDHKISADVVDVLISEGVVESIIWSLAADLEEVRMAAIRILVRCMEVDGNCRHVIAGKAKLEIILENFATVGDMERFEIVRFLFELVKLDRRTYNERLLHIIKDGGKFSTMHALVVYLQTALQDQSPIIAGLLLQLDILVEPRKASIYREEAIDALISCLRNPDINNSQLLAAETIVSLHGRFSSSGETVTRASLLRRAGLKKTSRPLMGSDQIDYNQDNSDENLEEDKVTDDWERKMAYALVSHEFGLLFEALAEGLKSEHRDLFSACLISASWLTYMLSILPDTGLRGAARVCLLKHFVLVLKSADDVDDKALAMLALSSFMNDTEGMHDLTFHIKDMIKTLRELKKSYVLANEMLKHLCRGQESCMLEMWNHQVKAQVDCSIHGEVLSIAYFKNRIISGHSDGTIMVWGSGDKLLHQIQETREHTKAVTSLAVLQSGKKLFSGSVDKSVRVWSLHDGHINCMEFHDTKDQVHNLNIANNMACFIPQGAGVKVLTWNGASKILNPNKSVKCLSLVQGKLYCGCSDGSIQEIDLATGTLGTIQAGSKKLLAKANPINALQVQDGLLYSASTPLDGAAIKIWNASNYSPVGSLPSILEVRSMTISSELIYLGSKTGAVEVWSKEKLSRVGTLQTGNNCRVQCMTFINDELLLVGTSDGKLQAWGLI
ncbi:putative E3 ubiquitin-protein ligase LIN-1 isoform X2 [Phalaenopsis equestris]|uniref:putative E3 ubiquitin-protein ligase LIN-1 isoform X2 n=1 Tax=Phalaenopsis equestris TaxID=78828 RepID=UPI0009E3F11E|nr:putative E3 ubiquitin-protein ligase LIN-1 isoform X2 [Phalaenopsis equestris]